MGWFKSRSDDDQARVNREVRRLLGDERIAKVFDEPAARNEPRDATIGGAVRGRLTSASPQGGASRNLALGGASTTGSYAEASHFASGEIEIHSDPREDTRPNRVVPRGDSRMLDAYKRDINTPGAKSREAQNRAPKSHDSLYGQQYEQAD